MEDRITSGEHLGVVRCWIKSRFINGDRVTWGTHEYLQQRDSFTVAELEHLAQDIRNAVIKEVSPTLTDVEQAMNQAMRDRRIDEISVSFKHHLAQAKVDNYTSPDFISFRGALMWILKKLQ